MALARDLATNGPNPADVALLLDRRPISAASPDTAPKVELRALFDALQLNRPHQPGESALDCAVTRSGRRAHVRVEDWPAPPVGRLGVATGHRGMRVE